MMIFIYRNENRETLAPLCCKSSLADLKMAGTTVNDIITTRWEAAIADFSDNRMLSAPLAFWPSKELLAKLAGIRENYILVDTEGKPLAWLNNDQSIPDGAPKIPVDENSFPILYPWHLLKVHEELLAEIKESKIEGTVREGVFIDGTLILGEGSVILPGVYIEGNVIIGEDCKIGPNCYIRGNTSIGDRCHIGQAVEIKNSLIGTKVSIGHLSYAGDSVISDNVNFGAGTIISNLRHDGRNHRWLENQAFVDTGRRKFGAIIGENVHTGIHTAIYPGRSLSAGSVTLPGEIVSRSK